MFNYTILITLVYIVISVVAFMYVKFIYEVLNLSISGLGVSCF